MRPNQTPRRGTLRTILHLIGFIPGLVLQILGMLFTLAGYALVTMGVTLRVLGAILSGFIIVTRGLIRGVAMLRA